MEVDILQAVILAPVGGYRVIGGGVVHLQAFNVQVPTVKCSVKSTLDGRHIVTTKGTICNVHHFTGAAVVRVAGIGVIDFYGDDIDRDCIITDLHFVDGGKSDCPASFFSCVVRIKQDDSGILVFAFALGEVVAFILHRAFGRGGSLVTGLDAHGLEVTPRAFRVEVVERDVYLRTGGSGAVQCFYIGAFIGTFDNIRHAA